MLKIDIVLVLGKDLVAFCLVALKLLQILLLK